MGTKNFKKSAVATVLGDKPKSTSAQMHKDADAQPDESIANSDPVRLHCFINVDLDRSLESELAHRKQNKQKFKGRDSKRAIVEEALEAHFR